MLCTNKKNVDIPKKNVDIPNKKSKSGLVIDHYWHLLNKSCRE